MEMEMEMEWDWENLGGFGWKAIDRRKKVQLVDWRMVDDGEIHGGSLNVCEGKSWMNGMASPTPTPTPEACVGLKLGRRTYFEKRRSVKKSRSSTQSPICCQVEGCSVDLLSAAKEYHRKHRVCDAHSKCPKVIVGGRERRFCQQCSRFHSLCEFDEKKRSCRRRLSDHNARRRKPQQETIHFNPPTPFYGLLNNSNSWNNSRFTGVSGEQLLRMPHSMIFNTVSPMEYRRALSLLSTNSCLPDSLQLHHENTSSTMTITHGVPQAVPFPSGSDFCPTQTFKAPYDAHLYSNLFNSS